MDTIFIIIVTKRCNVRLVRNGYRLIIRWRYQVNIAQVSRIIKYTWDGIDILCMVIQLG